MVNDNKKFFRRKEQLVLDAEYALAKATRMAGTVKQDRETEKVLKDSRKLDSDIEELERELQELEQ